MSNPNEAEDADFFMSQYNVVIVDDEENILHAFKRLTHREPYRLFCAGSGAEGLKLVAETPRVAVIISDQRMPEMNGSEFLARSRELAPDAIRMLFTGYSDMKTTVAAINEGGATRYISKPWEDSVLLQTVRDGVMRYHLINEKYHQHVIVCKKLIDLLHRLKEKNEELEFLASMDALTGLINRRRLLEHLENELNRTWRYGGSLSLIVFDIDHFKKINDTWGHSAGDSVLREIAHATKRVLRKADIIARYGGEEFVILLPETGLTGAVLISNMLLQLVANMAVVQEHGPPISVTISIGVAMVGPDDSAEDLLIRADQAMYRAKNNGRNRVEISND